MQLRPLFIGIVIAVAAQAASFGSVASKPSPRVQFVYFQAVISQRTPKARYAMQMRNTGGREIYSITDMVGHTAFRDRGQIKTDLIALQTHRFQQKKVRQLTVELQRYEHFLKSCPVIISGADLKADAKSDYDSTSKIWKVTINIKPEGVEKMNRFTSGHIGCIIAILRDGSIISAPNIWEPIKSSTIQFSGGFLSADDADSFANAVNTDARAQPAPR